MDDSALRDAIRQAMPVHEAPPHLRAWAREAAAAHREAAVNILPPSRAGIARRLLPIAALVVAAVGGWATRAIVDGQRMRANSTAALETQLLDAHLRSLTLDRLLEVRSTDRHTVKPWFAGKIDFVPRVLDLSPAGFPLLGGRVERIGGRAVAALVFGRRQHVLNVFTWPSASEASLDIHASPSGYTIGHWASGGTAFWVVTDAAPEEVRAFQRAYVSDGSAP